ncbi:glycosyltransferase [Periweissella fabalis]|uniref:Glycosyltransferase n=1 Tax=Periweissella fabalis TaxID=1070421 RepID=A0A7X6N147_9LACO|nr:glycosyltransferase [Periweissella fabalis]MCM0599501.1 glycosyltransferase [Periweissella fabalis]NKZ23806.1 glycosyltransferase [Periweissella fabalis]
MKLVTIVIPQYSEKESTILRLLTSINNQIGIDFTQVAIKIIGDAGYQLDTHLFTLFPNLDIEYTYCSKSSGPGKARQIGLDQADSKYIAYMDADDILSNVNSLWRFVDVINKTGDHQIIFTKYIEEFAPGKNGKNTYKIREYVPAAVYGKWLSVAYIREHKFTWHPELPSAYEDTYFMDLLLIFATDVYYLDSVTYTWLYRENSIVRQKIDYRSLHLHELVRENYFWVNEMRRRAPERLKFDINNALGLIYRVVNECKPVPEIIFEFNFEITRFLSENYSQIDLQYAAKLFSSENNVNDVTGFSDFWVNKLKQINASSKTTKDAELIVPNSKIVSIIMPFNGENVELLISQLSSINNQIGISLADIELIIVNDAGRPLDETIINAQFEKLTIIYINLTTKVGPGPARNKGLNIATGKFAMFCDADDHLHTIDALQQMYIAAQSENNVDIVMAKVVDEQLDKENSTQLVQWHYHYGTVYPNWYKLDFLRNYLIMFHEELHSFYEDTFFNALAFSLAKKVIYLDKHIYTHCLNNNSLIHKGKDIERQKAYLKEYVLENLFWFRESRQRFPERIKIDLNNFVINWYYMYESYGIQDSVLDNTLQTIMTTLINENAIYWDGWTKALQEDANRRDEGDAKGVTADNLKMFMQNMITESTD